MARWTVLFRKEGISIRANVSAHNILSLFFFLSCTRRDLDDHASACLFITHARPVPSTSGPYLYPRLAARTLIKWRNCDIKRPPVGSRERNERYCGMSLVRDEEYSVEKNKKRGKEKRRGRRCTAVIARQRLLNVNNADCPTREVYRSSFSAS